MSFHLSLSADRVSAAYPDQPLAVASTATVSDVLQLMRAQKGNCVVICDEGPILGIFTERDALRWLAERRPLDSPMSQAMNADPSVITAGATVGEAIQMMSQGRYRHLPIVDDRRVPTGVAAVRGIVRYLVEHFPSTIYNLPPEPGKAPAHREGA